PPSPVSPAQPSTAKGAPGLAQATLPSLPTTAWVGLVASRATLPVRGWDTSSLGIDPLDPVLPTATLPAALIRSASALLVLMTSGWASVVPRKLVVGLVPALPVRLQKVFARVGRSPSWMLPTLQVFAPVLRRYCPAALGPAFKPVPPLG